MRTIKFRGRRIDNNEWVYGYLYRLQLPSGEACMILTQDNNHMDNSLEPKYHLAFTLWVDLFIVDPATVGQFTSLLDKNGKEIYEGDIVKFTNLNTYVGIVQEDLCNPCMCISYKNEYGYEDIEYDFIKAGNMLIEVIGNIHDNPDLMKGGKE